MPSESSSFAGDRSAKTKHHPPEALETVAGLGGEHGTRGGEVALSRVSSLRMDAHGLRADFRANLKLITGESFKLAVAGKRERTGENGINIEEEGIGGELAADHNSVNLSAAAVRVEVGAP